jgi:hypothetical protein
MRRTIKTAKSGEHNTELTEDRDDSFRQHFNPVHRTYSHPLIGEVKLHNFAFNVAVDPVPALCKSLAPAPSDALNERLKTDLDKARFPAVKFFEEMKETVRKTKSAERKRRVLTSISHFRRLNIDQGNISKLSQMISNKAFGIQGSRDFMKACKDGDLRKAKYMLTDNRWLSQIKDHVNQTALHWAARRGNLEIAKLLIEQGCFVDSRDIAGRSPLHVACKFNYHDIVRILLEANADPYLKTNAGSYPHSNKVNIQRMLSQSKAKQVLKRFMSSDLVDVYIG